MERFAALFEAGNIGKLRLENRLIMAAMGNSLADNEGYVTEAMLDYYRARARGGVGLIITQFASINYDDMMPYSLGIYDDKFIPGLGKLVEAIHEEGTMVCIQLMHPGLLLSLLRSIPEEMTVKVPTIIPWMRGDKPCEEITEEDIDSYVNYFVEAAKRVKETGADAVELHACHGCLISTFLSPATNRRTDQYGGNKEKRTRFAQEIIEGIRGELGTEFPLLVRINGNDDVAGGVSTAEVVRQAVILEAAGADAVSISCGLESWSALMAPSYLAPEGVNMPVASEVKRALKVPVIVAGKVSPELAGQAIMEGTVDFFAFGRPLLADSDLPNKLREGRMEDIRWCIYCNNCLSSIWRSCTVNPFLYREATLPLVPTESVKRIMVLGGGIAGMQVAVLLAMRGHQVSLYEKSWRLGGQWYIACKIPGKQGYSSVTNHLERYLERYEVPVTLGTEVTKEHVLKLKPDVVIVATGAIPLKLDVPGASSPNVVKANDIVEGRTQTQGKVVVVGGRLLGIEAAILLTEQGNEVTLVSRSGLGGKKGPDEKITYRALMRRLVELRIPVYLNTAVLEVTEANVIVRMRDEVVSLPADTIVLAIGMEPVDKLVQDLEGIVPEIYTVGDCVQPGNAAQATFGAARLAIKI
ncbi:FAD-dependent oxidoreductase [Chloroflexota bacterium]